MSVQDQAWFIVLPGLLCSCAVLVLDERSSELCDTARVARQLICMLSSPSVKSIIIVALANYPINVPASSINYPALKELIMLGVTCRSMHFFFFY